MAEAPQKGDFHRLLDSAVIDRRYRKSFTIVTDGQGRTNLHRALRRRSFFVVFRLFKKVNRRLVVVVFQKVGSFIQTNAAWSAGRIYVPGSGNVLGLFACFIRHVFFLLALLARGNVFLWAGAGAVQNNATRHILLRSVQAARVPPSGCFALDEWQST